ncbi:MAG: hypothetical protein ACI3ZL_04485 [Candidatus Cryptobacteroides sp.]
MKKLVFAILFIFSSVLLSAQKQVVVIDYFKYASGVSASNATALRSSVIAGINAMNRVHLIDVDTESSLQMEVGRRNSELAMEDKTARAGAMKTLGANYLITGVVSRMDATYKTNDDGSSYYNGNIIYALTVINVENGTIVGTENYTYSGLSGNTGSTASDAVISTMNRVKQSMDNFVNEYFKLDGKVVEMNEASKKGDQAKSLYISLGSEAGIDKDQVLEVFEVKMIAGREAESNIGEIKVEEVVASDLSMCKVTKGGKEIMAAFQKGSELRVKTRKDSGFKNFLTGVADTFK